LDTLDDRYHETVSIATLAAEAAEWFDATPDEVAVVIEGDEVLPKTSSRKVAGGQEFSVVSTGKTAQEAFGKAAENARAESREEYPEGYSGTIAEKQGFVMVVPPAGVDPKKYAQWLMNDEESTDIQLVPGQKCPKCDGVIAKASGVMPSCPKCGLRASMSIGGYGGSPMKYYATEWGAFPPQHGAQVERDKRKIDDKWGPAGCVQLGPGKWMFFGTASS
jgi:hypothetical protein